MRNKHYGSILKLFIIILLFSIISHGCSENKPPFKPDYEIGVGLVIGKEKCYKDTTKNFWLIDMTGPNPSGKTYGNSISFEGNRYINVVKSPFLKNKELLIGKKYVFDFNLIEKTETPGCDNENSNIYLLSSIEIKLSSRIVN